MGLNNLTISKLRLVFHCIDLIGGAICLHVLAFSAILQQGYFRAIEASQPRILYTEIALTGFAATYFVYVYQREIRAYLKRIV